ncbi:oligosaccharide flippase family protein [Geothrix sp.]|uniref:oligosaccharide flippase family protein n=1 Tax=Geothrix sp. TaxID=1962974 RepID=UPI0025C2436A|nr:oligosaccharide flippase family protein [Geothrix sp.]
MSSRDSFSAVINNGAIIFASRLVVFASAFLSIRLLVKHLGISGYGTWEILAAMVASCTILTGPLVGTLLWKLSGAFGRGDWEGANRYIGIAFFIVICIFIIISIPAIWGRDWIADRFHLDSGIRTIFARVMPSLIFLALVGGINEVLATIVDSNQKMGTTTMIRTVNQLIFYVISIAMIILKFGLWSLFFGHLAMLVLNFISFMIFSKKYFPQLKCTLVFPTYTEFVELKNYYLLLAFGYLAAALRDQTDKLVLGVFASAEFVGIYAIASRIAALVTEASTFVFGPSISAAGSKHARGDVEGLQRLYMDLMLVVPLFAGLLALWVITVHRAFIYAWLGRSVPEATPLIVFMTCTYLFVVALTAAGASMCRGIGRVELESKYVAVGLVLNVIMTILGLAKFGAIATVYASGISWMIGAVYFLFIIHQENLLPLAGTWRAVRALTLWLFLMGLALLVAWLVPIPLSRWGATSRLLWLTGAGISIWGLGLAITMLLDSRVRKDMLGYIAVLHRKFA